MEDISISRMSTQNSASGVAKLNIPGKNLHTSKTLNMQYRNKIHPSKDTNSSTLVPICTTHQTRKECY